MLQKSSKSDGENREMINKMIERFETKLGVSTVSVKELQIWLKDEHWKKKYVVVDVREERERKISHIPGSISKKEFEANIARYKNRKIISYCTIGYRSGLFTKKLRKSGYAAFNLRGSILLWAHSQGDLIDTQGLPTKKVHVYGLRWDLLPAQYESVVD